MTSRIAIGIVLTIGGLSLASAQAPAGAQAPGRGRVGEPPPPYRPAAGAKDLRAVLFNWTWYMGMLRGVDEHELITSLEYQGKGAMQVEGQTCTRPNGQTVSGIEVVSGQYAWNEDIAGAEMVPVKGKVTPMPGAVQERLIRLWTESTRRAQGRDCSGRGDSQAGRQPGHPSPGRCHEGRRNVCVVGSWEGCCDVPDSGCPGGHSRRHIE